MGRKTGRGVVAVGPKRLALALTGLLLVGSGVVALAQGGSQSGSQQAPQQQSQPPAQDNPFPEEGSGAPQQAKPTQSKPGDAKPGDGKPADAKPGGTGDNPFPGENSDAPIIPVPGADAGSGNGTGDGTREYGTGAEPDPHRGADPDGDPMRSPDLDVRTADDGFTSSRAGLKQMPAEDDNDGRPGKSSKNKTRSQMIKEDVDVGSYYLQRKNWKAAQARFAAAFTLDGENPDAVWGMAEAERHLDQFKEAADHYKLFLNYDPDGPHSKSARKALDEVEAASH